MNARDRSRLEALLAERATQGLAPDADRELVVLLAANPEARDDERFDLAAAAIDLASLGELEEMPQSARERLASMARAWAEEMRRERN